MSFGNLSFQALSQALSLATKPNINIYTGCHKKNAPMFELAISPAKMAPEMKVK